MHKNRWTRELHRFLPLKSQFLLSGNIKDLHIREEDYGGEQKQTVWYSLSDYLALELQEYGYAYTIHYEPINGFSLSPLIASGNESEYLLEQLGISSGTHDLNSFMQAAERIVQYREQPIALIADFASQYLVHNQHLVAAEHQAFLQALILSQQAQPFPYGAKRKAFFNSILWIVDKEADLPDWMTVNNPKIRHISIAKPDHTSRKAIARSLLPSLPETSDKKSAGTQTASNDENNEELLQQFVDETEGLLLLDLTAIVDLARAEQLPRSAIKDAVRRYKVGVTEDPWAKIDKNKVRALHKNIQQRLKGQDHAITHMTDIIKRAITGINASKRGSRPRGVVFLAGPTGVGKTELAKTITQLLFGDENAYIRFDMSEFSAEHSDQRLIGAPPGYIGYDMGGELTNAVREKPFSVVLFDEIEKAHPRILDKFLQILDDGRLTSGRGDPVYFSETLIIFTSNLGIYRINADGSRSPNVTIEQPFAVVEQNIKKEIERYFKLQLNRPEILNRIGDNVIVFDFIRDSTARLIFDAMLESILKGVAEYQQIQLKFTETALTDLQTLCLDDLSHGGRGIRNKLEVHFVNPLARSLFDQDAQAGESWVINAVEQQDNQTTLRLNMEEAEF